MKRWGTRYTVHRGSKNTLFTNEKRDIPDCFDASSWAVIANDARIEGWLTDRA